ncbi:MAG: AEC family transporter [Ruminococcaceae bacterium]|nr:AEC family transporter [Oscillospiraceae bacterium]
MLSNLTYSINAVVPIFILVILGYLLKQFRFITEEFCEVSERVVFKIALPVMLFLEVAKSSLDVIGDMRLIWFCLITVTASFTVGAVLALLCIKDPARRGAFVQGACRSNFAILGVPLAENMFGTVGTQMIAIVMPFVILMFNSYSVIILSVFSSDAEHRLNKKSIVGILKNIVTNPLIIGVVLGLPFMLLDWEMPVIMHKSLTYLNNLCTPLALMSLGANFKPANMKGRVGYAVAASLCKTVILPGIMVTLAVLLGFRDAALGVVLILFGAPTAVSSYIMAKKMKNDGELAAQILLLTTLLCIFTIFAGIFILKTLQFI